MWSKGPFSRSRRPVGNNPTPEDMTDVSAAADPSLLKKNAKDLPALPSASTSSLPQQPAPPDNTDNNRYSAVSPVGSPDLGPTGVRDSGSSFCVSPIDEIDQPFQHTRKSSHAFGNAPVPQTSSTDTIPSAPEPVQSVPKTVQFSTHQDPTPIQQPVRWDDYSGEPTKSTTGRASQVNPRNTTFHKSSGSHASNFLHGVREQLQTKKKLAQARSRISSFSKTEPPAQRETRGRSSSRVLPLAEHSGNRSGTRNASPNVNNNLGFVPTTVTTITAGGVSKTLPERPAAGRGHSNTRRANLEQSERPERPEQPAQQAQPQQREQREQRDRQEPKFVDAQLEDMMQPTSRGEATQPSLISKGPSDSRSGSPSYRMQESPNFGSESTDDLPSIMSRRRPIPIGMPGMPSSKKPVRKPTPAEVPREPPVEDQPKDAVGRIESLEAKKDELAKRRYNLETVIHELTRVIQPGSFAYDAAAKAEVKKSVQSIENEIAEIKREEHELGLKVARAWRRLDEKENNGDGSNLWIKRVTS